MKSRYVHLAGAILLATVAIAPVIAGPISATPGIFKGVVHLNSATIPDAMQVDAQDVTHTYNASGAALQNDPVKCAAGSQNWCYSVTVESALAQSYYLRPIAKMSHASPVFVQENIPFPPTAPVAITAGATIVQDIPVVPYQPGEISGTVQVNDSANSPLSITRLYFSVNDLTNSQNLFQEGCGGSLEFCPYNSVFLSGAASPNPPGGPAYQLLLKPGEDYNYLSRAFDLAEGAAAKSTFVWDGGFHLGTLGTGQQVTKNYVFNQKAQVGGTVQLALPVYNLQTDVAGSTTTPGGFFDSFITNNTSGQPLASSVYVNRMFDNTDFTKGFTLSPVFTLSADGRTQLAYGPIAFTANTGDNKIINFSDTPSSIAGRVTFDPPYPAGNIYPGIQAEAANGGGYGSAQTTLLTDAHGGTYFLPVFAGNWDFWRFGWSFDLGNPNLTTWYFVGQFLPIHIPVAAGQSLTNQEFKFDTAKLKVLFSAPPNTTISDPQLNAQSGHFVNGNFVLDGADSAHSEGLNQKKVLNGEADMVFRVDSNLAFRVVPSAIINTDPNAPGTGRTDFSPLTLKPNKGDVITVGVPGTLSLTVNTPVEGQVLGGCQVPVSGTATGTTGITITVNGQAVATSSTGNPNDPNEVKFNTTVAGNGTNTAITVVASAPANTSVTSVIHVTAGSATVNTSASVSTSLLWPPNHNLVNVGLTASAVSACDAHPTLGITVFSNESETADTGDGPFAPDAANSAPSTLRLRSERSGNGDGRIYLILATGHEQGGGSGKTCTSVVVPQDQSKASVNAIQAAAASAIASCKLTGLAPAGFRQIGISAPIGPKQ